MTGIYDTKQGYEAYVLYLALKRHFESQSYDFFKYNGKVNVKPETFLNRRDKFMFHKLSKKRDPRGLIISNIVSNRNKKIWVGDLLNDDAEDIYLQWLKRIQSLTYDFRLQLKYLGENLEDFQKSVSVENGQHPELLKSFLRGDVSIEFLILLNSVVKFFPHWNTKIKTQIIWEPINNMCSKYEPFLHYDASALKKLVLKRFE